MISAKVCLLGDFGVGKTSCIARYVHNEYSDRYLTTVGVKIDTRVVQRNAIDRLKMVIWDIAGSAVLSTLQQTYIKGAEGFLLVVDGTRYETLESSYQIRASMTDEQRNKPLIMLLNKVDLLDDWEMPEAEVEKLRADGINVMTSSALNGENVEKAFDLLATKLIGE